MLLFVRCPPYHRAVILIARAWVDSTESLIRRAKSGDQGAIGDLYARYLSRLKRWAHGRLPSGCRDILDTDDVVQDALVQTLAKLEGFESRGQGAFHAYLRQAVLNKVRDEIRRASRRGPVGELTTSRPDESPSPLQATIGGQVLERYEAALAKLAEREREAVICRIELGFEYAEIAEALAMPSPDAARMAVSRALVRLAKEMSDVR